MALAACLAVVVFVGPSIPVGEGHRDLIFNLAAASASVLGILLVVALWRTSGTPARVALGLLAAAEAQNRQAGFVRMLRPRTAGALVCGLVGLLGGAGCTLLQRGEVSGGFYQPRFLGKPGSHELAITVRYERSIRGSSVDLILIPTKGPSRTLEHRFTVYRVDTDTGQVRKLATRHFPEGYSYGRAEVRDEWDGDAFFIQLRAASDPSRGIRILRVEADGAIREIAAVPETAKKYEPPLRGARTSGGKPTVASVERREAISVALAKGRTLRTTTDGRNEYAVQFCLLPGSFELISWKHPRFQASIRE